MASDDASEAQNVPDIYLEPIRISLTEPDYSRLDKPVRPPLPPAAGALSPMTNGNGVAGHMSSGTMSPESKDPTAFFSNDDAFASNAAANDTVSYWIVEKYETTLQSVVSLVFENLSLIFKL